MNPGRYPGVTLSYDLLGLQPFESASVAWLRQRLLLFVADLFHPAGRLYSTFSISGSGLNVTHALS